ncbi:uncharacterized protein LOC106717144 isoform X1 [Papilio machaon]|uniref:uncharacterized protein LOC106717144 isoform X1 n=2 Tax=Papilio machaon TaxID=76193 RepID=UPI001E66491B|nr:uncharacterized protein LOC106717144 isoform X1 [Papilio machaon]
MVGTFTYKKMSAYESRDYFTENGTYKDLNPLTTRIIGDFTPFYITIAICTILLTFMIILNIICCCSKYSDYWLDRHTGNRWIVSIWSATPHRQPPLDFTEIEVHGQPFQFASYPTKDYQEVHKSESVVPSISQQPLTYLDLHERESDI